MPRRPSLPSNDKTWTMTRIGPDTWVRVDIDGPVGVKELEALKRYVEMQLGWAREDEPPFICSGCRAKLDDTFAGQCFSCFTRPLAAEPNGTRTEDGNG